MKLADASRRTSKLQYVWSSTWIGFGRAYSAVFGTIGKFHWSRCVPNRAGIDQSNAASSGWIWSV